MYACLYLYNCKHIYLFVYIYIYISISISISLYLYIVGDKYAYFSINGGSCSVTPLTAIQGCGCVFGAPWTLDSLTEVTFNNVLGWETSS